MAGRNGFAGVCALAAAVMVQAAPVAAAEIRVDRSGGSFARVQVSGEIRLGDENAFIAAVDGLDRAVVELSGPGGKLAPAMTMGALIRKRGFATVVTGTCMSACSTIWLAGVERFAADDARIGFHASYVDNGGTLTQSGAGNAIKGAYMRDLGYGVEAIVFVTDAPPDGITLLTRADAATTGITFAPVESLVGWAPSRDVQTASVQRTDPAMPASTPHPDSGWTVRPVAASPAAVGGPLTSQYRDNLRSCVSLRAGCETARLTPSDRDYLRYELRGQMLSADEVDQIVSVRMSGR